MITLAQQHTHSGEGVIISMNSLNTPPSFLNNLQIERRLQLLYSVSQVVVKEYSLQEAAPNILRAICIVGGWKAAELWKFDRQRKMLTKVAQWSSPLLQHDLSSFSKRQTLGFGRGTPGKVWVKGQSVWSTDLSQDLSDDEKKPPAGSAEFLGMIGIPVRCNNVFFGALSLLSDSPKKPDTETTEVLELIGNQIGDFMKRKEIEDSLRESEKRFRTLIEHNSDAIISIDTKGIIHYASSSCEKIFGLKSEHILGKELLSFIHPDDLLIGFNLINSATVQPDIPIVATYRLKGHTGALRWVESIARNLIGEPSIRGIIVNTRDITERKEAEEEFRLVVETSPNGMMLMNKEGNITMVNAQTESLFGYNREELIGKTIEMLVPPQLRDRHRQDREVYTGAAEARPMGAGRDLFGYRKDGTMIPVEIGLTPIKTSAEDFILVTIIDIAERKQAEAAINKLNEELEDRVLQRTAQLEEANKELETFSYSISHDLRSPLRAIDGFSRELLLKHAPQIDAAGQRYLEIIRGKTRKMGTMIDDLLGFSRISRQEFEKEPVDMDSIAHNIAEECRKTSGYEHAVIEIIDLPYSLGSISLLKHVLVNLIENALKFSKKKNSLRVTVGATKGIHEHTYYVKDNGVGFDMAKSSKLFGVFQRLHDEKEFEGTGVGLAIVQRIIHKHGGKIWAESAPGEGATFYFTLPSTKAN